MRWLGYARGWTLFAAQFARKDIVDYIQILAHRVMPHFLGQDARGLEHFVDEVYVTNSSYKLAGQEFWCPAAYIEQSLFYLMGKTLKKPAGELMGSVPRKEIPAAAWPRPTRAA